MTDGPDETLAAKGGQVVPFAQRRAGDAGATPQLREFLAIHAWADREIPEPEKLLGDMVTRSTRAFFVGTTGLGKTMFAFAMAEGMASGQGFLHWRSSRAARVLYVDGEMAADLIKARSIDALRRGGTVSKPGMLTIYSRDFEEQIAGRFPTVGKIAPLNTADGHLFIMNLIDAIGGVDVVIFDNVMSLLSGVQKDEETWTEAQPLVAKLSAGNVGQLWFDHTGHNKNQQYGASVKAWSFDAVGMMTPLPDDQRQPREVAFQLSFEPPAGKARRRTPDNWDQFETCIIRLAEDRWTSDRCEVGKPPVKPKVSPTALAFHRALLAAAASSLIPSETTRTAWYAECVRLGLVDPLSDDDSRAGKDRKLSKHRKYLSELKVAGWIEVDGETVRMRRMDAPE
jgi:hypothetical protein